MKNIFFQLKKPLAYYIAGVAVVNSNMLNMSNMCDMLHHSVKEKLFQFPLFRQLPAEFQF
jgi:hypothetical protein